MMRKGGDCIARATRRLGFGGIEDEVNMVLFFTGSLCLAFCPFTNSHVYDCLKKALF